MPPNPNSVQLARLAAVRRCIDDLWQRLVKNANNAPILAVGIGSGSTIQLAIDELATRFSSARESQQSWISRVRCVPTSYQSRLALIQAGLPTASLDEHWDLLWAVDGADECDAQLNLIKGGGGCHLQEKLVAFNAQHLAIVVDFQKESQILGTRWTKGVPLEVHPLATPFVIQHLHKSVLKCKPDSVKIREGTPSKAGPCVTDNGNFIVDAQFDEHWMRDPAALNRELLTVPGILETGLFVGMADAIYIGQEDGTVKELKSNK